jgi:hypothetical protein
VTYGIVTDTDPALFVSDIYDANQKNFSEESHLYQITTVDRLGKLSIHELFNYKKVKNSTCTMYIVHVSSLPAAVSWAQTLLE